MNIAIGATLHKKITKDSNGGTEMFAYILGTELKKKGHSVTFFASGGSQVNGNLIPISTEEETNKVEQGQRLFYGYQLFESYLITEKQNDFDVIHINYFEPFLFAPFSRLIKKPVIYTIHSDLLISPAWQTLIANMVKSNDKFVFVSKSALSQASLLNNPTYVYNGIDIDQFPFSDNHEDYLFWLGRVRRKKGIKEAVQAASASNKELVISGVIDSAEGKYFFDSEIKPLINMNKFIKFIGPSDFAPKVKLYQKAKAFIFPVGWEEPFGLTIVEAMACGTPVIAYDRGAIPEIIEDGKTGFIVNSSNVDKRANHIIKKTGIAGLKEAISKLYSMTTEEYKNMCLNCRENAEKYFSSKKMVDNYEKIYKQIYG